MKTEKLVLGKPVFTASYTAVLKQESRLISVRYFSIDLIPERESSCPHPG